ncbi:MAG: hypothetical protein ACRDYC_09210 [Acidimicrobiales bacterium]
MEGHLITAEGECPEVTPANIKRLIDSSTHFWLDLDDLDVETTQLVLRDTFGFHPLAVEDSEQFGQRPKLDRYEGFILMVVYGTTPWGGLAEVHCF